jgi:hypothetical protein
VDLLLVGLWGELAQQLDHWVVLQHWVDLHRLVQILATEMGQGMCFNTPTR